jgi:hypothetical protein
LSQSWQARRNRRRRLRRKSRKFRETRSRDEFLEYLGAQWWARKEQAAKAEERERGCAGGQARGVQALMTLIVIGTVQGGEREGAPIGFMKREGVGGRQPEEEEERGVKPVGLPNINNNCHVSAAIHLAAIERGYNEATNTQLWENANNHTGTKGRMEYGT